MKRNGRVFDILRDKERVIHDRGFRDGIRRIRVSGEQINGEDEEKRKEEGQRK
jgi:hypothetical protein